MYVRNENAYLKLIEMGLVQVHVLLRSVFEAMVAVSFFVWL